MLKQATTPKKERKPAETRAKLVGATVQLILRQGFSATSVDQICSEAGVTKGSFFHHFETKEALGKAAVEWWGDFGTSLYAEAWKDTGLDPLQQLYQMLDIMAGFTQRDQVCTCVVGMLSQELAQSHPGMRAECERQLEIWTANVAKLLTEAKARHAPSADFDPQEVAWFLNSIWQGSMLIGKTREAQGPTMIRRNLAFARSWLAELMGNPSSTR